jgi:UDP-N-acetylglucosamine--N-acetylmuramyl-(pentapeptide) pyrophosphoryl-undecaprenol N-acetylglucosamine transferase
MTADRTRTDTVWCVVAGGGTAGHVHPGLAIAAELCSRGHRRDSILFVGSERGVDRDLVPAAGFNLVTLPGRGIQRRLTFQNVGSLVGLFRAFWSALSLLKRERPAVVVSLGGYASIPCSVAALFLRIPVVIAEQNAVPGAANRLVGRWAKAAAISFPDTDLPRATYTGNPVRAEMLTIDRAVGRDGARAKLEIGKDRTFVCCYGGSLGARRINEAVFEASEAWSERGDLSIRHVLGARDWDDFSESLPEPPPGGLEYRAVRYETDMESILTAADLLVCRAGASTTAELTVTGAPAVLIPLPGAPGDHQTANAKALADAGAALLLPDDEMSAETLQETVDQLIHRPERLEEMSTRSRHLGRPDAAAAVADLVEGHARV